MGKIWVEADPRLEDGKVAIWDRNTEHPDGEIFIVAGDPKAPFEIADTPEVRDAIQQGRLTLAQGKSSDGDAPQPNQAARRRAGADDDEE